MKKNLSITILVALLISSISFMIFLYGCSGSSGGSYGGSYGTSSTAENTYAKVGVLIADGPADEYDSIKVTITSVSLLPADCPDKKDCEAISLFYSKEGYVLDLLQYRDEDFLLTLNEAVPAGTYGKIRLGISKIDPYGGPCDEMDIKLPGKKLDLNPHEPIVIKEGDSLYIRLDIDANKSINIHKAGKSDKCVFRPVVFVDILPEGSAPASCRQAVTGTIIELADTHDDPEVDRITIERPLPCLGTLQVQLDDDTLIFNEQGLFAGVDELDINQRVNVWGNLSGGYLHATLIVIGNPLFLRGTVEEPVEEGHFILNPDIYEPISGLIQVNILYNTALIAGCSDQVDPGYLEQGKQVLVIGKYIMDDAAIHAAVIFVKDLEISGHVDSIEHVGGGYSFTIVSADEDTSFVFIPTGTEIRFIGDGEITADKIDLLACGENLVKITKDAEDVTTVGVQASALIGVVEEDVYDDTIRIDGLTIEVMPSVTIIDISGESDTLISPSLINAGDTITCFGLQTCSGNTVDFYAYVILVTL